MRSFKAQNVNFKVGDKVVLIESTDAMDEEISALVKFGRYEVTSIDSGMLSINNIPSKLHRSRFIHERDFTETCLNHLEELKVTIIPKNRTGYNYYANLNFNGSLQGDSTKEGLLNTLYPTQSPEQIEISKIEQEMKVLAERLDKLKEKL